MNCGIVKDDNENKNGCTRIYTFDESGKIFADYVCDFGEDIFFDGYCVKNGFKVISFVFASHKTNMTFNAKRFFTYNGLQEKPSIRMDRSLKDVQTLSDKKAAWNVSYSPKKDTIVPNYGIIDLPYDANEFKPDKAAILAVRKCLSENEEYGAMIAEKSYPPIKDIDSIHYVSGVKTDFDGDGKEENVVCAAYYYENPPADWFGNGNGDHLVMPYIMFVDDDGSIQNITADGLFEPPTYRLIIYEDCIHLCYAGKYYGGLCTFIDGKVTDYPCCEKDGEIFSEYGYMSEYYRLFMWDKKNKVYVAAKEEISRKALTAEIPDIANALNEIESEAGAKITKIETVGFREFIFTFDRETHSYYCKRDKLSCFFDGKTLLADSINDISSDENITTVSGVNYFKLKNDGAKLLITPVTYVRDKQTDKEIALPTDITVLDSDIYDMHYSSFDYNEFPNLKKIRGSGFVDPTLINNSLPQLEYLDVWATGADEYDFSKCKKLKKLLVFGTSEQLAEVKWWRILQNLPRDCEIEVTLGERNRI